MDRKIKRWSRLFLGNLVCKGLIEGIIMNNKTLSVVRSLREPKNYERGFLEMNGSEYYGYLIGIRKYDEDKVPQYIRLTFYIDGNNFMLDLILHRRDNLPALCSYKNNIFFEKKYCINGMYCTVGDYPAIETYDGTKKYYKHGKLHRRGDLPAVIHINGANEYYKKGVLHRRGDLPAVDHEGWLKKYYKHGQLHRKGDRPAVITMSLKEYYKHGKLHRKNNLPAIVFLDGRKHFHNNNKFFRGERLFGTKIVQL